MGVCLNVLGVSGGGLRRLLSLHCIGTVTLALPGRPDERESTWTQQNIQSWITETSREPAASGREPRWVASWVLITPRKIVFIEREWMFLLFVLFSVVPPLIKPPPRLLFCVWEQATAPERERYRRGEMDVSARLCMGGRSNPQWGPPSRTLRLYHRLNAFQREEEGERCGHESLAGGGRTPAGLCSEPLPAPTVDSIAWSCTFCSQPLAQHWVCGSNHPNAQQWVCGFERGPTGCGRGGGREATALGETASSLETHVSRFSFFFLKGVALSRFRRRFFTPSSPAVRRERVKSVVNRPSNNLRERRGDSCCVLLKSNCFLLVINITVGPYLSMARSEGLGLSLHVRLVILSNICDDKPYLSALNPQCHWPPVTHT